MGNRWWLVLTGVLLLAALAGVAISGYLAWENSQGKSGVCTVVHGCSTVQQSKYGKILGVPVSVPGLGLYLVLAVAAVVTMLDFRGWRAYATLIGFYGALMGLAMSAYLTYLEAFVIDAWCIYCIASALLMVLLAAGWSANLMRELRLRRSA
ncbi:MAG: vitamin K epoxide reductase family protein [Dehalococcoidia bacterium]